MAKITKKFRAVSKKSIDSLKTDGIQGFTKRSARYVYYKQFPEKKKKAYKDILFINGCSLPHPARYRVDHQVEQLNACGITAESVFYDHLSLDMLKYYRGFVFFRCPVTETINEFIKEARQFNKTCFFDIDDLVIDEKYTDHIEYVQQMPADEKKLYNDGVNRMRETLQLCDYVITTTERLQTELKKYNKEVFINRNVASDEMVARSLHALQVSKKDPTKITIGYFSGSITHNENFSIVMPALVKLLGKYDNLYLKIAGYLDIPQELEPYKGRIICVDFMPWRTMPREIATCDINIAPLKNSIFNEAKSENKWTEAALVKVVTVASNVGAFKHAIKDRETGLLVNDDEWLGVLDDLIKNTEKRENIAAVAQKDALENHTTIYTANPLAEFVKSRLSRNIGFILPSTDISGGITVIVKHAEILKKNGWDVTLIDAVDQKDLKKSMKKYDYRLSVPGNNVIIWHKAKIEAHFDTMVATLWSTLRYLRRYPSAANKLYLVQSYETDFSVWGATKPRIRANATYADDTGVRYITISKWCQKWLKDKFNQPAKYAPNGINLRNYPYRKRSFQGGEKIHILIEGDSKSEYKNTDEAFKIIEKLDPKKYEISYLSYRREPKPWYRVDHFYNRIAPEEVGKIYSSCDILIKTSLVESFSYPPIEMLATGGLCVVLPNGGNMEYLRDGENCLFYEQGNINDAVKKIERILKDKNLRDRLIKHGTETARSRNWENLEEKILRIYK